MIAPILNLLRRTPGIILAVAAAAAFLCPPLALAQQTFSLSGGNCTVTVQPDGSFSVGCSKVGGGTTGQAIVSFTNPPSGMTAGTGTTFTVSRSGTSGGDVTVSWAASGGCSGGSTVALTGTTTSNSFTVTPASTAAGSVCTIALSNLTNTTGYTFAGGTSTLSFTVATASGGTGGGGGGGGGGGNTASCPTGYVEPADLSVTDLGISGHGNTIPLKSGQIGAAPLPAIAPNVNSGQIIMTESSGGPVGAVIVELSISKCRGYMPSGSATAAGNPGGGACYFKSNVATTSSLLWAVRPIPGVNAAGLESYGVCSAMDNAPYFFNLRYTYSQCFYGTCSYIVEWYNGWF